jgi:hypothetical protein
LRAWSSLSILNVSTSTVHGMSKFDIFRGTSTYIKARSIIIKSGPLSPNATYLPTPLLSPHPSTIIGCQPITLNKGASQIKSDSVMTR